MVSPANGPLNGAPIGGAQRTVLGAFSGYLLQSLSPLALGVPTYIPIDALTRPPSPIFGWAIGAPEVEVKADGAYRLGFDMSADNANNARSQAFWGIEIDRNNGVGFLLEPETQAFSYHRNAAAGRQTATAEVDVDLVAGSRFRVFGSLLAGVGVVTPVINGCRIRALRL